MLQTKEHALEILEKLGWENYKKRNYKVAIVYYERYLEFDDTNPNIYNMLGYLYKKLSKYQTLDTQVKYFEKAIELNPDFEQANRNLALVYPLVGKYKEAAQCFKKVLNINPIVDDYMAYSFLCIKAGDFEEGWKYYEYRFQRPYGPTEYPKIDYKPKWEGQKIPDKTLLVHYEQGFGDSLQFFRYLHQVKPYAKKVIFRVQDELVDLFKNSTSDFGIYGISTPVEDLEFDYHISLMSLPYRLKSGVDEIPLAQGYVKADEKLVKKYQKKYFDNDCFKIGINWSGRVLGNKLRDVPLECFYPLAELKNTKLYSLQHGVRAKQLEEVPSDIEIVDLGNTFKTFSHTAAAMQNLDLFISSDNAVFNLAGAMGKKTFLLLNFDSEWRWMRDEETTPWYDSVKIFKKKEETQSWASLMTQVIETIKR